MMKNIFCVLKKFKNLVKIKIKYKNKTHIIKSKTNHKTQSSKQHAPPLDLGFLSTHSISYPSFSFFIFGLGFWLGNILVGNVNSEETHIRNGNGFMFRLGLDLGNGPK